MRAIRLIYYGYSVYSPIVATEHRSASPQWQERPCSHNTKAMSSLAILGSMLSRFMSPCPILECLTTAFVWLCDASHIIWQFEILYSTEVSIQMVTYVPFAGLQFVTWSVGTTYWIRINAKIQVLSVSMTVNWRQQRWIGSEHLVVGVWQLPYNIRVIETVAIYGRATSEDFLLWYQGNSYGLHWW